MFRTLLLCIDIFVEVAPESHRQSYIHTYNVVLNGRREVQRLEVPWEGKGRVSDGTTSSSEEPAP